ncbi:MAG: RES family NAD+ phosphorylase [Thermoanaerobaculia bacterium]
MSSRTPDPPLPDLLHPLVYSWRKGRYLIRCHNTLFEPTSFNPGMGSGRFHPFEDADGNVVPILYAAEHPDGALAETIFHDVPVRGFAKRIPKSVLDPLVLSALSPSRNLKLAQLFGFGLRRLGVTRRELIEASKKQYPRTTAWARSLHHCDEKIDGLVWISRQHDGVRSIVLFGDRVPSSALRSVGISLPLHNGPGYDLVRSAADRAGILIVD